MLASTLTLTTSLFSHSLCWHINSNNEVVCRYQRIQTAVVKHNSHIISLLPNQFIGTSGESVEYGILFFINLYGCIRLLTQICPTLTVLYVTKMPLRLIWLICHAFFYFAFFILINWSGVFKWYSVVSVRQIWVGKRTLTYRSTNYKIPYSWGSLEVPVN